MTKRKANNEMNRVLNSQSDTNAEVKEMLKCVEFVPGAALINLLLS